MKIRVFQFIKDVYHEPKPQFCPYVKGYVLIVDGSFGLSVSHKGNEVVMVTGHGLPDEFKIGEEVEELKGVAAAEIITERAMGKLTPDERQALRTVLEARLK